MRPSARAGGMSIRFSLAGTSGAAIFGGGTPGGASTVRPRPLAEPASAAQSSALTRRLADSSHAGFTVTPQAGASGTATSPSTTVRTGR